MFWIIRIFAAVSLLIAAIVRIAAKDNIADGIDNTFLYFIVIAFLIMVIPWDRLKYFKAAGVEVKLEQEGVNAAIDELPEIDVDIEDDALQKKLKEELQKKLLAFGDTLSVVRGSKILWIDDEPHSIRGVRRIVRSLGIVITSCVSSEDALQVLNNDNDYDLIVTDVQRTGENYREVEGGVPDHEGVNFIVKLRKHTDPYIKEIPVIFYASYEWEILVKYTRPAREILPEPEISRRVDDFVIKLINRLVEEKSKPIKYNASKKPDSIKADNAEDAEERKEPEEG